MEIKIENLLELLIAHGGKIVSSNNLSPEGIEQARASGRMYVDSFGYGFIWEPCIMKFPETVNEVEEFEKWYPLEPKNIAPLDVERILNNKEEKK